MKLEDAKKPREFKGLGTESMHNLIHAVDILHALQSDLKSNRGNWIGYKKLDNAIEELEKLQKIEMGMGGGLKKESE